MKNNAMIFKKLCIAGIICFAISILVEVIPKKCMVQVFPFIVCHNSYIVSLFLGVFTGAVVGMVTVYIQYTNAKFEETGKLVLRLIDIINRISSYNPNTNNEMDKAKNLIEIRDLDILEVGWIITNMQFIIDPFSRKQKCIYERFYKKLQTLKENIAANTRFLDLYAQGNLAPDIPGIQKDIESCESLLVKKVTIQDESKRMKCTTYEPFLSKELSSDIEKLLYPIGYGKSLTKKIRKNKTKEDTTNEKT